MGPWSVVFLWDGRCFAPASVIATSGACGGMPLPGLGFMLFAYLGCPRTARPGKLRIVMFRSVTGTLTKLLILSPPRRGRHMDGRLRS
eukprot:15275344-Alexandrium_andersonii.AAC.1